MYRKVRNTSKPFGERVTALNKLRLNLKNQAIAVVCVSALISCVCYLILNSVGTYLLDQCLSKQVHVEQRNKEMLQSLQEYVSQQDLHVEDTNDIDIWLDSQREGYLMMGIYQNDQLIYDSTAYRLGTGYLTRRIRKAKQTALRHKPLYLPMEMRRFCCTDTMTVRIIQLRPL